MFTRLLVLHGIKVVATDLLDSRLRLARQFGARWVFRPGGLEVQSLKSKVQSPKSKVAAGLAGPVATLAELVERITRGRGLDAAVIAVPSEAVVREAQSLVRGAGQVLLFSHTRRGDLAPVDFATICVDEKDLIGSYSADFLLQAEVARLVFTRKVDAYRLITHQFPLAQTAAAVELAAHPTNDSLKIVVTPGAGIGDWHTTIASTAHPPLSFRP
jgi:L-iditol 2-dehydrogenase